METIAIDIVRETGGVFVPLGLRMVGGLVIGIVLAAIYRVVYGRLSKSGRSGFAGFLAILIFGISGFLLPLAFGLERTITEATDLAIPRIADEFEQQIAAQGLDPHSLDAAEVQQAVDQMLEELERDPDTQISDAQQERVRAVAADIRSAIGDEGELSTTELLFRTRDAVLAPLYRLLPFAIGVLIGIPILFVAISLPIARRS